MHQWRRKADGVRKISATGEVHLKNGIWAQREKM